MTHLETEIPDDIKALLQEQNRRDLTYNRILRQCFDAQLKFINDGSRLKIAQCTRRAGKSSGLGYKYLATAQKYPGCNMLYLGLTKATAFKILWKDCLAKPARKLRLKFSSKNEQEGIIRFPNGTDLYIGGADADESEMEKLLGVKYKYGAVDEAQSFTIDLKRMIYQVLLPAFMDEQGEICLTGSPNNNVHSFFFRASMGIEPGWSIHKWSALDNPHMRDKFIKEIEFLKKSHPGIETTPWFRQQYLNEWVVDDSLRVYKYDQSLNNLERLPDGKFTYVLGVDFGYDDPTAFVICAYRDYDPLLYVVSAYQRAGMNLSDVAVYIRELEKKYRLSKMIVDGAHKQAVEELKHRFSLPLEATEKHGKAELISICNSDFSRGIIKMIQPDSSPYRDWETDRKSVV